MRGVLSVIEAIRPASLNELLTALADPAARPLAGGTDVMVRLEAAIQDDATSVDLSGRASELRYVRLEAEALAIGPLATFWDLRIRPDVIVEFPLLEAAARTIGAVQIQGRGTWAGNIANGSPRRGRSGGA